MALEISLMYKMMDEKYDGRRDMIAEEFLLVKFQIKTIFSHTSSHEPTNQMCAKKSILKVG